jgi:putative transposase
LDALYPILYLDCIVVKIRQDKRVINKAIYLALGVTQEGKKDLLGSLMFENEGAKFWFSIRPNSRIWASKMCLSPVSVA